jgi:hypothetical protein
MTNSQVKLGSLQIPSMMSDSVSIFTSLLEVMTSFQDERVRIRDLSDLTLDIVFDAQWGSIFVGLQGHIVWNMYRYSPSRCVNLHCGMK